MKIDLIIGGASKSGTTALFEILRSNESFFLPAKKELHYFSRPYLSDAQQGPGDRFVLSNIPKTYEQYISNFAEKREDQIAVDISPSYLFYEDSVDEIFEKLPDVKIIFILRRPDEKIFSQYLHLVAEGREKMGFREALLYENYRKSVGYSDMFLYKESGYYADKINTFITRMGRDRVKLILFDEFRSNPATTLQGICDFLGLQGEKKFNLDVKSNISGSPRSKALAKFIGPNSITNWARRVLPSSIGLRLRNLLRSINTGEKPLLDKDLQLELLEAYDEDILKLETILGYKTHWRTCDWQEKLEENAL